MSWCTIWKCQRALAGLDVERQQARAEQVVAGAEAAEEVDGRRIGRDVDEPALGIGRHRRPRRHVAGAPPRVVLPGVVPELARPRDDVELPQRLAGARRRRPGCRPGCSRCASGSSPARGRCPRRPRRSRRSAATTWRGCRGRAGCRGRRRTCISDGEPRLPVASPGPAACRRRRWRGNPGIGTRAPQFSRCWPVLASSACRKNAGEV